MESGAGELQLAARISVAGTASRLDPRFRDEVGALYAGPSLTLCCQCGTCSGSCPTVGRMEYSPRRIMHMVLLGMADEVLRSHDIWFCVSCYSCAARCPQGIEIADVMAALRSLSIAKGLARDREATFSSTFLEVLKRHGRMYEPEVLARYFAAEANLGAILKMAPVGLRMFRKGKIGLRPERIENAGELAEIAARITGARSGAGSGGEES